MGNTIFRNFVFLLVALLTLSCSRKEGFVCRACYNDGVAAAAALGSLSSIENTLNGQSVGASLISGTNGQLKATGLYTNGSTQEITNIVSWTTSNPAVATVDKDGRVTAVAPGTVTIQSTSADVTASINIVITADSLNSIGVTITDASLPLGLTTQARATGVFLSGATQDLTNTVTWSSSATGVASVDSSGVVSSLAPGATMVRASYLGVTGQVALNVTNASLVSIGVTPVNSSVALGIAQQFTATGVYTDSSTQDITSSVTWASSDAAVAQVSNTSGTNGLVGTLTTGAVTITASLNGKSGSTGLTVTNASLVSLAVTAAQSNLPLGVNTQLTVMGTFSNGSVQDLTSAATFSSSNASVATVSNASGTLGLVSSVATGSASITATVGSVSGNVSISVVGAQLTSIGITPVNSSLAKGLTLQMAATGVYTDSSTVDLTSQVTWTSSNVGRATISNAVGSHGLVSAVSQGAVTITAAFNGVSGTTNLTITNASLISMGVTPANASVALGNSNQYVATGVYSDASTQDLTSQVTWTSSNISVSSISNAVGSNGLANTLNTGSTVISAVLSGISGSTNLNVTAATLVSINITPGNSSINLGLGVQLTAVGTYTNGTTQDITSQVTWSSADSAIATVSNVSGSNGLVASAGVGATTISAALGGITTSATVTVTSASLVSIAVTPANPSIAKGLTEQFTATGTYTDNSTQDLTTTVAWTSSNTAVASISNAVGSHGLASGLTVGSTVISASLNGKSGSTGLDVSAATLVSIGVTPPNPSIALGLSEQFTATGVYTDGTTQDLTNAATWMSSVPSKVTVSNAVGSNGLASSIAVGGTVISATLSGKSGSTNLTVTAASLTSIAVTPTNPSIALGLSEAFTATGTYSDNSTLDITTQVTWASSNVSVATISNANGSNGVASTVGTGTAVISATLSGKSGTTNLTVNAASLVSIGVTPAIPNIALGLTQQFVAMGVYTDNSTQDISQLVTWTSSNTGVASISNANGSKGLASTVSVGISTISASLNGVSGSASLTVTNASLVSIAVTPANHGVALGLSRQMTAIGTYTDNSTQDLTTSVTWQSANPSIASISNAVGSNGLAYGAGLGSTTLSATLSGVTGSTGFTVATAALMSIAVTPANQSIALGLNQQYVATGTYSNGITMNLSSSVTWASSAASVATISNVGGSKGLASSVAVGSTVISASLNGVTGSTNLTITAASLSSISVTPSTATVAGSSSISITPSTTTVSLGVNQAYVATGTYSDGSTQTITSSVTWTSSNTSVATISNASGSKGLASSVGVGTATLTATDAVSGVSGAATLNVTSATLNSLELVIAKTTLTKGETIQAYAIAHYSNGDVDVTLHDLTAWTSKDTCRMTVTSIETMSKGFVTALNIGTNITLQVAFGGMTATALITIQ